MRLLDTNVVVDTVRDPLSTDTGRLSVMASESARSGEPLVVSESVFVECIWVLCATLGHSAAEAVRILRAVLDAEGIEAWDTDLAAEALDIHADEPRLDIVDCLLAARVRLDGAEVVTADRLLRRWIAEHHDAEGDAPAEAGPR
jgi:predicted nucleic-acid-binding protein